MSAASKSEVLEPYQVFIGNIHERVTSEDLKRHFNKIVPVTHAIVIQDKLTYHHHSYHHALLSYVPFRLLRLLGIWGRSTGKGYITCKEESDVDR